MYLKISQKLTMDFVLITILFFLSSDSNYARECSAEMNKTGVAEESKTVDSKTTYDIEEIKDLIKNKNIESAADIISKISKQAGESRTPLNGGSSISSMNKGYSCSKIDCSTEDKIRHVCACNFNTGNVASFKNKCDSIKHNCRFDTNFQVILEDICPWEFAFRRAKGFQFDYRDSKYYN